MQAPPAPEAAGLSHHPTQQHDTQSRATQDWVRPRVTPDCVQRVLARIRESVSTEVYYQPDLLLRIQPCEAPEARGLAHHPNRAPTPVTRSSSPPLAPSDVLRIPFPASTSLHAASAAQEARARLRHPNRATYQPVESSRLANRESVRPPAFSSEFSPSGEAAVPRGLGSPVRISDNSCELFSGHAERETARFNRQLKTDEKMDLVCTICLEGLSGTRENVALSCYHVFHLACVTSWVASQRTCPLCRTAVQ